MKSAFIAMGIAFVLIAILLFAFIKMTEKKGAEMGIHSTTYEETK